MKSRMSFFNGTVIRRNLIRWCPIWISAALYLILSASTTVAAIDEVNPAFLPAALRNGILSYGHHPWLWLAYGMGCSLVIFSYLLNKSLSNLYHSLPVRRETLLCSGLFSGICLYLIPALLGLLVRGGYAISRGGFNALPGVVQLLAIDSCEFFFSFAVGVLCVMLAGNVAGFLSLGVVLHFGMILVEDAVRQLLAPLLYGIGGSYGSMSGTLSPMYFCEYNLISVYWDNMEDVVVNWRYLSFMAIAAVLVLAAGYFIYRRRQMECTGNLIAVKSLQAAGEIVLTLVSTLLLSMAVNTYVINVTSGFWKVTGALIGSLAVGFFLVQILFSKNVFVFSGKRMMKLGIWAAGLGLILLGVRFDVLRIADRVPAAGSVAKAEVCLNYGGTVNITDPADLQELLQIHRLLTAQRPKPAQSEENITLELNYRYHNGSTMSRAYAFALDPQHFADAGSIESRLTGLMMKPDYLWAQSFYTSPNSISDVIRADITIQSPEEDQENWWNQSHVESLDQKQANEIYEAMLRDMQEGTVLVPDLFRPGQQTQTQVSVDLLCLTADGDGTWLTLTPTNRSANLNAVLSKYNILINTEQS